MSAETLRRAAKLIRERAWAASASHPGRWLVESVETEHTRLHYIRTDEGGYDGAVSEVIASKLAAEHIAGMHPAVALFVAEWLNEVADGWEGTAARFSPDGPFADIGTWSVPEHHPALALARAYLGADA